MTLTAAARLRELPWVRLGTLAAVAAVAVAAWKFLPVSDWLEFFVPWIQNRGWRAYLIFVLIYLCASCIGFPITPLNIGAGIIFNFWAGLMTVLVAGVLTQATTFSIARYFARDWIEQRLSRIPNADRIMAAVEEEGLKLVILLRLNPFVPAVVKGYGFGTTRIGLKTYLLGSFFGSLPLATAYVYLGHIGGMVMLSGQELPEGMSTMVLIGGVVTSVILMAILILMSRKALHRRIKAR